MNRRFGNRYELISLLGQGGYAEVYLAHDSFYKDQAVALKIFRPQDQAGIRENFIREFQRLKEFKHPNLTEVYDFGFERESGCYFFSCEYIAGSNLLQASAAMNLDELLMLMLQICRALAYLHAQNFLHGDIKPANILVTGPLEAPARIKLLDFSAGQRIGDSGRSGTLSYMAPEMILGKPVGPTADIYSFGIMLYEILTRQCPAFFPDSSEIIAWHLSTYPPEPHRIEATIPGRLSQLIMRMIQKEPSARPQNIKELENDLLALLNPEKKAQYYKIQLTPLAPGLFVGREHEREHLLRLYQASKIAGTDQILLLSGEEGIGKSRLIQELKSAIQTAGDPLYLIECESFAAAFLGPLEELFRRQLIDLGQEMVDYRPILEPLALIFPSLLPLLEAALPGIVRQQAEMAGQLGELPEKEVWRLEILSSALQKIASARRTSSPLTIIFDHFPGEDAPLVRAVDYLLRNLALTDEAAVRPVFFWIFVPIALGPENLFPRATAMDKPISLERMDIPNLTPSDTARLIESIFHLQPVAPAIIEAIYQSAEGNPLFVKELVQALPLENMLFQDDVWQLVPAARSIEAILPGKLEEMLRQRFNRLARTNQDFLEQLALYRDYVPTAFFDAFLAGPDGAAILLQHVRDGLIAERDMAGQPWIKLRYAIHRQILSKRLTAEQKMARHAQAAANYCQNAQTKHITPEIAHHYLAAQIWLAGAEFALKSAGEYQARYEYDQALGQYEIALAAGQNAGLPCSAAHKVGYADLLLRNNRAALALAVYQEIGPTLPPGIDLARLWRKIGLCALHLGDIPLATSAYATAFDLAVAPALHDAASHEFLQICLGCCRLHIQRGDYNQARILAETGLKTLASSSGNGKDSLLFFDVMGLIHFYQGEYQRSEEWYQQAIKVENADLYSQSRLQNSLGMLYQRQGEYDQALKQYRLSYELALKIADIPGAATFAMNIGTIQHERSEYDLAIRSYEASRQLAQKIADNQIIVRVSVNLGNLYLALGRFDLAQKLLGQALELARQFGMHMFAGYSLLLLGEIEARGQQPEAALKWLGEALEVFRQSHSRREIGLTCLRLAEIWLKKDGARSEYYLHEAGEIAREVEALDLRLEHELLRAKIILAKGAEGTKQLAGLFREEFQAKRDDVRPELKWDIHHMLAQIESRRKNFTKAVFHFHRVAELAQAILRNVPGEMRKDFMKAKDYHQLIADMKILKQLIEEQFGPFMPDSSPAAPRFGSISYELPAIWNNSRFNLPRFLELNKALNETDDLDQLLGVIMDTAIDLTRAERGFLIMAKEAGGMEIRVARNIDGEDIAESHRKISHSIAQKVATEQKAIIAVDALTDDRFIEYFSVHDLQLRSIISVPLKVKDEVIGSIYLDNRFKEGSFTEEDLAAIRAFADQAALAIRKATLIRENIAQNQELFESKKKIEKLNLELEEKLARQSEQLEEVQEILSREKEHLAIKYDYSNIIGQASVMKDVFLLLDRVVESDIPVVIEGDSGTGKEMVARAIHYNGKRQREPFLSINCAAIPEDLMEAELFGYMKGAFTGAIKDKAGLFELAHRGSLFLDEIGEMSPNMQKKLLRVLQEQEVRRLGGKDTIKIDVRIISASNKDLKMLMQAGRFREDLFYRINVVEIQLPPLRERKEDIPRLVDHFIEQECRDLRKAKILCDEHIMPYLLLYDWPGNIRELKNEVKRWVVLSDGPVSLSMLSARILKAADGRKMIGFMDVLSSGGKLTELLDAFEKKVIMEALRTTEGNKVRAAHLLGIGRRTLYEKMEKHHLKDFKISGD